MNGFYNHVTRILKQHGWVFDRQGGSHEIWHKQGSIPVTVSTNCKSRHTANKIMKDAGIKHKF